MEVYILFGREFLHSDVFLGVYHTISDAEFHRDLYAQKETNFNVYNIERRVIGARPEQNQSVTVPLT